MRTFAVVNQKGGCGKTTTAINLSGVFAGRGYRTLLVDMDPQGHCAAGLAIPEGRVDLHIGDAMLAPDDRPVDPQRLLWRVSRNLDLAPATLKLAGLEAARGELAQRTDAESRLKTVLRRFDSQYDICLIDCSPAIGLLAFNALVAADEVIIPVETGFFSMQGATKQVNTIKAIGKRLGIAPTHRLLATMHDPASVLSRDLLDELRRRFGTRVVPVVITADHSLREAASFGQPVIEYAKESQGAKDYGALADWLIDNVMKAGSSRPADSDGAGMEPHATPGAMPRVEVVAGIGERALADGGAEMVEAPSATGSVPPPPFHSPTSTGAMMTAAPGMSRAADMAQRTRKLARAVAIAEAKPRTEPAAGGAMMAVGAPPRDLFAAPAAAPTPSTSPSAEIEAMPMARPSVQAPEPTTARPVFGAHATSRGVLFVQPLSIGASVAVAGEFNDWTPEPLRANPVTGVLEAMLSIKPGYSQYRLVVDGKWMPDPFNPVSAPNPFGGSNSVLVVPMGAGVDAPAVARRVG